MCVPVVTLAWRGGLGRAALGMPLGKCLPPAPLVFMHWTSLSPDAAGCCCTSLGGCIFTLLGKVLFENWDMGASG